MIDGQHYKGNDMDRDVRDRFIDSDRLQRENYGKLIKKCDDIIFLGHVATWIVMIGVAAVLGLILFY